MHQRVEQFQRVEAEAVAVGSQRALGGAVIPLKLEDGALLLGCLAFSLLGLSAAAVGASPDEAVYVQTALESLGRVDPWLATAEGSPHWYKPPLLYWLMSGAMAVLGPTALAARLPAALFGYGAAVCLCFLARRLFSPEAGRTALVLTVSSLGLLKYGRTAMMDTGLLFGFALGVLVLVRASQRQRPRELLALCVPFALMLWLKGPTLLVVLAFTLVVATLVFDPRALRTPWLWVSLALGIVLGSPWYVVWILRDPGPFVAEFFVSENVARINAQWSLGSPAKLLITLALFSVPGSLLALRARPGPSRSGQRLGLAWAFAAVLPFAASAVTHLQWSVPASGGLMLLAASPPVRAWPGWLLAAVLAVAGAACVVGGPWLFDGVAAACAVGAGLILMAAAALLRAGRELAALKGWCVAVALLVVGPLTTFAGEVVPDTVVAKVRNRGVFVSAQAPGLVSLSLGRPVRSTPLEEVRTLIARGDAVIGFAEQLPCSEPGITCLTWRRMTMFSSSADGARALAERSLEPLRTTWACAMRDAQPERLRSPAQDVAPERGLD